MVRFEASMVRYLRNVRNAAECQRGDGIDAEDVKRAFSAVKTGIQ
jgi:hypothetical protein